MVDIGSLVGRFRDRMQWMSFSDIFDSERLVYIVIFTVAVFAFSVLFSGPLRLRRRRKRYYNAGLAQLDRMSGEEFELVCEALFHRQGYRTETTMKSNDYGADLILYKNGVRYSVQCKRYKIDGKMHKVGNSAVQEVIGSMAFYGTQKAIVITTSFFSPNAEKLARANGVILIDRNDLSEMLKKNRDIIRVRMLSL